MSCYVTFISHYVMVLTAVCRLCDYGSCNVLLVIPRLNDAPVRGYEDDVGNKTTMRLFYPESASYNPSIHNDPDTLMVLVPFKQQDVRWLKEILYNEKRVLYWM